MLRAEIVQLTKKVTFLWHEIEVLSTAEADKQMAVTGMKRANLRTLQAIEQRDSAQAERNTIRAECDALAATNKQLWEALNEVTFKNSLGMARKLRDGEDKLQPLDLYPAAGKRMAMVGLASASLTRWERKSTATVRRSDGRYSRSRTLPVAVSHKI